MTANSTPTLLRIDASARQEGSHSRQLADAVEATWLARHPNGRVLRRDLATQPLPHIAAATIQGFYTPPGQHSAELREATAMSDTLIAELKSADLLLISAPIYNFGVPSALKAWIDQVVRIGHTFAYENGNFSGLVPTPRAVLTLAYGAAGYQGPLAAMDHLKPYLVSLLGFLGIADVRVVATEATTADPETVERNVRAALDSVLTLVA